ESLKSLVDEFSQFARMPAPRTVPADLHPLLTDTLSLYNGLLDHITIEPRFAASVPRVRVDPEQFRRVIINLVDNAIEALNGAREAGLEAGNGHGHAGELVGGAASGAVVSGAVVSGAAASDGVASDAAASDAAPSDAAPSDAVEAKGRTAAIGRTAS